MLNFGRGIHEHIQSFLLVEIKKRNPRTNENFYSANKHFHYYLKW